MKHIEDGIQAAFIQWVRLAEKQDERLKLLFHVPNGGRRNVLEAVRLKKAGVVPGVPDIMLPVSSGLFHGLAIEFKRPGGKLTSAQIEFIDRLVDYGWAVVICTSTEAAIQTVKDYLG